MHINHNYNYCGNNNLTNKMIIELIKKHSIKGDPGRDGSYTQKAYKSYVSMVADKDNIPANTNVVVNNDLDKSKNAYYTYDGVNFTKSDFDPQGILTSIDLRLNKAIESASDYFQGEVADAINLITLDNTDSFNGAIESFKDYWNGIFTATNKLIERDLENAINSLYATSANTVRDAINNTATPEGKLADTFVTVTANEGYPATNLRELVSSIREDFNVIYKNIIHAEKLGFKTSPAGLESGGYFDNTPLWNDLVTKLVSGDTVKFNAGHYYFSDELIINGGFGLKGIDRTLTRLVFPQSSGVTRTKAFSSIRDLSIYGSKTATELDPKNKVFGRVGLLDKFDRNSGLDARDNTLENVEISDFDSGRVLTALGDSIWAGAYRYNSNVHLMRNRINLVCKEGITHESFFGGTIAGATEVGVWAQSDGHVSNIMFYGTTLEANPIDMSNNIKILDTSKVSPKYCNIYAGERSFISLFGCYEEATVNYVEDGGCISSSGGFTNEGSLTVSLNGMLSYTGTSYLGEYHQLNVYPNMNILANANNGTYVKQSVTPKLRSSAQNLNSTRFTYKAVPTAQTTYAQISAATKIDFYGLKLSHLNIRARDALAIRIGLDYTVVACPINVAIDVISFVFDTAGNYVRVKNIPKFAQNKASNISTFGNSVSINTPIITGQLPAPAGNLSHYEYLDNIQFTIGLVDKTTGDIYAPREDDLVIIDIKGINIGLNLKNSNESVNKIIAYTEGNLEVFNLIKNKVSSIDAGYNFYRTDLNKLLTWNGAEWTSPPVFVEPV